MESSCINLGEELLMPTCWGRTAIDLGRDEGSTGEPKGFLRAGWNRVLMVISYAAVLWESSGRLKERCALDVTESYFLVMQGINMFFGGWSEPHMRKVEDREGGQALGLVTGDAPRGWQSSK